MQNSVIWLIQTFQMSDIGQEMHTADGWHFFTFYPRVWHGADVGIWERRLICFINEKWWNNMGKFWRVTPNSTVLTQPPFLLLHISFLVWFISDVCRNNCKHNGPTVWSSASFLHFFIIYVLTPCFHIICEIVDLDFIIVLWSRYTISLVSWWMVFGWACFIQNLALWSWENKQFNLPEAQVLHL